MRTSNPAFSNAMFNDLARERNTSATMTVEGTAFKTLALLMILMVAAAFTWTQASRNLGLRDLLVGVFGGFGTALLTILSPISRRSPRRFTRCSKDSSSARFPT